MRVLVDVIAELVADLDVDADPELDLAIRLHPRMEAFLQQDIHERADYEASIAQLHATIGATHHV